MTTRTASRPRADLSREAVIDHALAIADTDGLDAVTIRRLGQDFGVTPMALYWHVTNKDELLNAMGDRLFAGTRPVLDPGTPWPDRLRTVIDALLAALRAHPGSVSLAGARVLLCDDGRDLAEQTLTILDEAGFSVTEAADIARHALQTAVMLVSGQAGTEPGIAEADRAAVLAAKAAALAGLPAGRFPHLRAAAGALTDCADPAAYYRFGTELFVSGVQALQAGTAP